MASRPLSPHPLAPRDGFTAGDGAALVLAVVLHAALLAVLVLGAPGRHAEPPPPRMVVTISDQIAAKSTSPTPAAAAAPDVAPVLGETPPTPPEPAKPAPIKPEPIKPVPAMPAPAKPTPKPEPAKPAPAKPVPTKPAPTKPVPTKPTPQPPADKHKQGGSRIGSDFLAGVAGATAPGTAHTPPADSFGPQVKASLAASLARQIKPHWVAPPGLDIDKLVTVLSWTLNPDGSLAGRPVVVSQSGITPANRAQAARHAEQAIRAVQLAAPFDLPPLYYSAWKQVRFRFDWTTAQ